MKAIRYSMLYKMPVSKGYVGFVLGKRQRTAGILCDRCTGLLKETLRDVEKKLDFTLRAYSHGNIFVVAVMSLDREKFNA
ncbi:hypothetical protein F7734_51205 [Scytonema sp. UIC 10036]|uniref:hypothetical protein n=1 Tax=Scytonema sp. UIC 10036 TaxID=2304196 RepID=UPI0012DA85ED|nr:hypothetical protein [Scytonema sp. UIC 10036]MUH00201.1 hypothetical protein [Scytonema sp. UIC 10036]